VTQFIRLALSKATGEWVFINPEYVSHFSASETVPTEWTVLQMSNGSTIEVQESLAAVAKQLMPAIP
jgi:uncharacterized protein YlzI (FlbEa/FlbD family)